MAIAETITLIKSLYELAVNFATQSRMWWQKRETSSLIERFLRVHNEHGILTAQIPRVLGMEDKLKPQDVLNPSRLLERLDNEMLRTTCEVFGVQREWLEGADVPPYTSPFFYKNPRALLEFLKDLAGKHQNLRLWCFKSESVPLERVSNDDLYVVIVADNFVLGERIVERFYPIHSDWPWDHLPARLDFKALIFICWQLEIYSIGREAPSTEIEKVRNGLNFPSSFLERYRHSGQWHPDDYIFTKEESVVAKDSDEVRLLKEWLGDAGVLQQLGDCNLR